MQTELTPSKYFAWLQGLDDASLLAETEKRFESVGRVPALTWGFADLALQECKRRGLKWPLWIRLRLSRTEWRLHRGKPAAACVSPMDGSLALLPPPAKKWRAHAFLLSRSDGEYRYRSLFTYGQN